MALAYAAVNDATKNKPQTMAWLKLFAASLPVLTRGRDGCNINSSVAGVIFHALRVVWMITWRPTPAKSPLYHPGSQIKKHVTTLTCSAWIRWTFHSTHWPMRAKPWQWVRHKSDEVRTTSTSGSHSEWQQSPQAPLPPLRHPPSP